MVINKTRIRKISPYSRIIPKGDNVYVAAADVDPSLLIKIGFPSTLDAGASILPTPQGPTSLFNAEGKLIKHKDKPMETAYTTIQWSWTEFHGDQRVERTEFRDRPYQRYPRSFVPPPGAELNLHYDVDDRLVVHTSLIKNWQHNEKEIVHAVNLLLELFGECMFLDEKMEHVVQTPTKKLNWRLLPPGKRPFEALKKELAPILDRVKGGNRAFSEHRLETVNSYNPKETYIGEGGFVGYIVFGFPDRSVHVLESILYGNATYVLGEDWKEISKKSKAEIIAGDLHEHRIIHHQSWKSNLDDLFH